MANDAVDVEEERADVGVVDEVSCRAWVCQDFLNSGKDGGIGETVEDGGVSDECLNDGGGWRDGGLG